MTKLVKEIIFADNDKAIGEAYRQVVDIFNTQGFESFMSHMENHYPDTSWNQLYVTFESEVETDKSVETKEEIV
jgi:hypothetical protein